MNCPIHKNQTMEEAVFYNTGVSYCPDCLGMWFEQDEFRQAKDEKDKELTWLDVDLWKDKKKFRVGKTIKPCPTCSLPLYAVEYGDSDIEVDICNVCHGIWLDRAEFKKVMDYLEKQGKAELAQRYWQNLIEQGAEIITGPESFKEEAGDFWAVLKLLDANFLTQHPVISQIILNLPK